MLLPPNAAGVGRRTAGMAHARLGLLQLREAILEALTALNASHPAALAGHYDGWQLPESYLLVRSLQARAAGPLSAGAAGQSYPRVSFGRSRVQEDLNIVQEANFEWNCVAFDQDRMGMVRARAWDLQRMPAPPRPLMKRGTLAPAAPAGVPVRIRATGALWLRGFC
jgi:hypothetical protein